MTVYVAYDSRASSIPNWLASWTPTSEALPIAGVNHKLYYLNFSAGPVILGGNAAVGAAGAGSNYSVAIVGPGGSTPPPPPSSNQAPVADAGTD